MLSYFHSAGSMAELLEIAMVLAFGAAWPAAIMKSVRSRTAKGKSVAFLLIVAFGYLCGIASKFVGGNVNYVLAFYILNLSAVSIDIGLYIRNRSLDAAAGR